MPQHTDGIKNIQVSGRVVAEHLRGVKVTWTILEHPVCPVGEAIDIHRKTAIENAGEKAE